jgi:hypothetical protein
MLISKSDVFLMQFSCNKAFYSVDRNCALQKAPSGHPTTTQQPNNNQTKRKKQERNKGR